MVDATVRVLEQIGVTELLRVVVADAGYWPSSEIASW